MCCGNTPGAAVSVKVHLMNQLCACCVWKPQGIEKRESAASWKVYGMHLPVFRNRIKQKLRTDLTRKRELHMGEKCINIRVILYL